MKIELSEELKVRFQILADAKTGSKMMMRMVAEDSNALWELVKKAYPEYNIEGSYTEKGFLCMPFQEAKTVRKWRKKKKTV